MQLKCLAQREGRLSSFLLGELKMSSSLMNKLKWGDAIQVNGEPRRTNFPVKAGDIITVRLEEEEPEYPAEEGPLEILYEDDYLLAVDKPAGMLIHPSHAQFEGTLANFVAGYFEATGQRSAFHPVTRLDRDTFGVVLLAKNSHIHGALQGSDVEKIYHGLVFGGPEEDRGIIDAPIARRPMPSLLRCISPEGKPSVTQYRVLQRWENRTLLELRPITGRTHQLRLHCAHMGFPILGDPQYGTEKSLELSKEMGFSYQRLCAKSVSFVHPITGQHLTVTTNMTAQG
jgi:23S rRNA pseudouridine1911/1915/1917 synthase